jgi:RecG-like helicase
MFLRELTASLDHLKGAGPAAIRALAKGGVIGVGDLLCRYPRDWEDRSVTIPLGAFQKHPAVCTVVRVLAHDWFGFGRMRTLKVHVEDDSARAVLVCFNRPFLEKQLEVGESYRLWGRFYYKYGEIQSTAFEVEPVSPAGSGRPDGPGARGNFGGILPIYPLSAGLTQGLLRRLIQRALTQYTPPLEDELPQGIIARDGLLPKARAIRGIHFPASPEELDLARKTLIYEELFYLEVMVGQRAMERRAGGAASRPPPSSESSENRERLKRIEKFRDAPQLSLNGMAYAGNYELNPGSAGLYLKNKLRGIGYKNKDTGATFFINRTGKKEIMSHDRHDKAHLKVIIHLPTLIKNARYITEEVSRKKDARYEKYRYLLAGFTMEGREYTIKMVIGIDRYGQWYYDHKVYEINKTALIENRLTKPVDKGGLSGEGPKTPIYYKDTTLLTILQAPAVPKAAASGKAGDFSPLQRRLLERLPFKLTAGQEGAVGEINRDMGGPFPMARLLQGDVGSGKTLVAFLAALRAVDGEARGQAAIMAPTELLARQHAENAAALLEPLGVRPAFLTGNLKAAGRAALLKNLAAGEIDILVGTHALFSRDVAYRNLRLVVVDEQHRFGVTQRQAIMAKGYGSTIDPGPPDLLMMSATPIPRTLALTVFGDLDVSIIPDLPPGRKPIKTHLARESNEDKVYAFVGKELAAGHQAYFVYPLIEAGDNRDMKDVESMAERLAQEVFPRSRVALVHSKLEEEEKRKTMDAFRRGEIALLAATSVVEVGVDVPNATCMVIEHAERFGLSALHQLRGRVGRGEAQSYCFLVYSDELTEDGKARLKVMLENTDGFIIAEEDLKLRGPGQIAGIEQSGYLTLGIADPIRDAAELARARTDAFAMLEQDPNLESAEYRRVAETLRRAPPFARVVL